MFNMHKCKTVTNSECNPTTSIEYKQKYDMLKSSVNNLEEVRSSLINKKVSIMKTQDVDSFEIPMKRNCFGLLTIPVIVNETICNFIIDTGAQMSAIKETLMEKLNIKKECGRLEIGSASGLKKNMNGCILNKLILGRITFENLPVLCLNKEDFTFRIGSIDCFRFDGIIGWDILQTLDFELDDVKKRFKVLKNIYKFSYENFVPGIFPAFLVENHKKNILAFGFDSGSKRSWINKESASKYGYTHIYNMNAHTFGVHGFEKVELHVYDEIILYLFKAKITINQIMSGNCKIFENIELDGVLGNEIFKGRRIRLINSKGIVLLL